MKFLCTTLQIFGEYDEWYAEAKQLISSSVGNSTAADAQRVQLKPPTLARDVISFHYVSTVESQLLYRILNAQLQTEQNSHSTHDKVNNQQSSVHGESVAHTTTNDSVLFPALCFSEDGTSAYGDKTSSGGGGGEKQTCLSVRDILDMWPRAGEQVGHYSRPLAKGAAGLKQAVSLHAYLSQVTIEQKRPGC